METDQWKHDLEAFRRKLEGFSGDHSHKKDVFNQSFREYWFSDALAWLLDPRGSHGLGVEPLKEFVRTIAMKRSNPNLDYQRTSNRLKHGKGGRGKPSSGFSLMNASIVREFHLSKSLGAFPDRGTRFCDLMLMDFDKAESLIIVIENKITGENQPDQLEGYFQSTENKFEYLVNRREYVYLTLMGKKPIAHVNENIRNWVNIGWVPDLLPIVEKFDRKNVNPRLRELRDMLRWIKDLDDYVEPKEIEFLQQTMLQGFSQCLLEELKRLTIKGSWSIKEKKKSVQITHSSYPARMLKLYARGAGPSIELQGVKGEKGLFETMVIPCNLHPNQTKNLIDLYVKVLLESFFESSNKYIREKNSRSDKDFGKKNEYDDLFRFLYEFPNTSEFLLELV